MKRFLAMTVICAAVACGLVSCATTAPAENQAPAQDKAPAEAKRAPLPADAVITWTDDALQAFTAEVPKAVQKIARRQMEKEARERGIAVIDMAFYEEIKKEQGR